MKSTNYYNTFIEVADDCPVAKAEVPLSKGDKRTAAAIQYEMIISNPYKYTSDDVIFYVFAEKNGLIEEEYTHQRENFFSKGQACLRCSPLVKRYGWGIHNNHEGKVAIYPLGSDKYEELINNGDLQHVKGMRSSRM